MQIKHAFTSQKPDSANASLIKPSNWNADHVISGVAYGTTTVFANSLSRVVNHNLGAVPKVFLEPLGIGGIMHYVTDKTTTQFTINLAAPQENDVDFDWEAIII